MLARYTRAYMRISVRRARVPPTNCRKTLVGCCAEAAGVEWGYAPRQAALAIGRLSSLLGAFIFSFAPHQYDRRAPYHRAPVCPPQGRLTLSLSFYLAHSRSSVRAIASLYLALGRTPARCSFLLLCLSCSDVLSAPVIVGSFFVPPPGTFLRERLGASPFSLPPPTSVHRSVRRRDHAKCASSSSSSSSSFLFAFLPARSRRLTTASCPPLPPPPTLVILPSCALSPFSSQLPSFSLPTPTALFPLRHPPAPSWPLLPRHPRFLHARIHPRTTQEKQRWRSVSVFRES